VRILFDKNIAVPPRRFLPGHDIRQSDRLKWGRLENGDLLAAAEEAGFDVLLTSDQNIAYQQNL
jgi:hypothetical protein